MYRAVNFLSLIVVLMIVSACKRGADCYKPVDCELGFHCVLTPGALGAAGECRQECVTQEDCPSDGTDLTFGFCSNEGKCVVRPIPPRIRIVSPENDSLLPVNTRKIQLSGELETVASSVNVTVTPRLSNSCEPGPVRSISVTNPEPGRQSTFPFIINDYDLDPGVTSLTVTAQLGNIQRKLIHIVEVPCLGCASIEIDRTLTPNTGDGLLLRRITGTINPATNSNAIWRVRNQLGDVIDGSLPVKNGAFLLESVPLFPGLNRIQVVVTGSGNGVAENRCSINVVAGQAQEKGLRTILTWDGKTSDLDIHLVGPQGRLFDPLTSIWSRNQTANFEGEVVDDFDGLGPELGTVSNLKDGVYGVVVEQVFDDQDSGSNALMHILLDGRPAVRRPVGPQYLSDNNAEYWIVGTVTATAGVATWTTINERLDRSVPPTKPPSMWPDYY